MRWQPLSIVGGSYRDDTRPWTYQDTINLIPVAAEKPDTKSPSLLRCVPGFTLYSDTGETFGMRGLRNVEGTLYAVVGSHLYRVNVDSTTEQIGSIPGVERVSMAHNQIANGNQLAIAANSAGYVYDTVANTLTQITDEGFPGAISFDYIDQYITFIDPSRNFAGISDLADATSYNTLDRFQAESQPDKLAGQAVTHGELWLFGERTIQPFQDTGAGTGTFQPAQGEIMEIGCAAGATIQKLDNSVFWLGNDGIVYRANGYTPDRISTHALEEAISRCNISQAFAFTFEDRGHKVYYLTFPDGETWGFDAASGEWHRRKSYNLDRWRVNHMAYWNGGWYGGDFANGKIYKFDWNVQHENGAILERRRILMAPWDNQNATIVNALEIVADTGEPQVDTTPTFQLSISGDVPGGTVGLVEDYQYTITATFRPTSCAITSGALPTGCTMDSNGHVTGTATASGTFSWTVTVTDSQGNTATLDDSAVIVDPITVDGAIAHWKLNDSGSTAVDSSGNGFDLAYTGAVTKQSETITPGGDDAALFGGGCAYGAWAPLGTLPVTGNGFSVCAWIRHPALQLYTASASCRIAGCWEVRDFSDAGNFGLLLARAGAGGQSGADDKPWFFVGKHNYIGLSGGTIPVDTPVLLTATLDAAHTTMKFYAGTSLIASGPLNGTIQFVPQDVIRIGGSEAYPTSYDFQGVISDVILFNKELTADDINDLDARGTADLTYAAFP